MGLLTVPVDRVGLCGALRRLKDVVRHKDILVALPTSEPPVPLAIKNHVYRTVLQGLTNAIVRGQAQKIEVRVDFDRGFNIVIVDDGIGFDVQAARRLAEGLGLPNMENRVRALGSKISIVSEPGRGTHISISIPTTEVKS
jgi:signal transduction histidine kinase